MTQKNARSRFLGLVLGLAAGCADDAQGDSGAGSTDLGSTTQSETGAPDTTTGTPTSTTDGATGTTAVDASDDDGADTTASTTAQTGGENEGGGTIDVTLSGCDVDFSGTVVVSYNGSLGVASVYDGGGTLSGSFQFDLDGPGVYTLSSQHRVDTGTVVNMVDIAQGTWTNLDSDALSGGVDRIGGTLTIAAWDPAAGVSDIELDGVSLLNVVDGNVCIIDGTIVTTQLYP